jgi:hypothetical protein
VDTLDLDSAICHPELIYRTPQNIKYHSHSAINWLRFIACILIFMGLSWLAWKYTRNGALCKDESYDEKGNPKPMPERPYSFSRVQLLWWTMIVFICYIFSFAITGTLIPINSTMAILLGCGAIVYAGGRIIDNKQLGDKNQRPQDKENGKGFFEDILSDDSGVSIHRFQALVFNVIFGVAYLSYFFSKFKAELYPFISFTNWQFALIGISSATYLGLKANENGGGNGGGGQNGNGSKSGNGSGQGGNGGGQVGNQQGGQSVTQQGGQGVTQQGGQVGNQQGGQSVTQQGGQGGNQQGGQGGNQQGGQGGNQQGGQGGNQQGGNQPDA